MSAAKPKPCARCGSEDVAVCHETLEHPMKVAYCMCRECMRYGPRVRSGILRNHALPG